MTRPTAAGILFGNTQGYAMRQANDTDEAPVQGARKPHGSGERRHDPSLGQWAVAIPVFALGAIYGWSAFWGLLTEVRSLLEYGSQVAGPLSAVALAMLSVLGLATIVAGFGILLGRTWGLALGIAVSLAWLIPPLYVIVDDLLFYQETMDGLGVIVGAIGLLLPGLVVLVLVTRALATRPR
jgi:hypothetical protein